MLWITKGGVDVGKGLGGIWGSCSMTYQTLRREKGDFNISWDIGSGRKVY